MLKLNVALDDLSTMPGAGFEKMELIQRLIDRGLKVDMFLIFSCIRNGCGPFLISDNKGFVDQLKAVNTKSVRVNVHGWNHGWNGENDNEFFSGSSRHIYDALDSIDNTINETGIKVYKVFRPPCWRISQMAIDMLAKHRYTHLSLFQQYRKRLFYENLFVPSSMKLHYCNASPPNEPIPSGDIVDLSVTYHLLDGLENTLSHAHIDSLFRFIDGKQVKPFFISDM